MKRTLTAGAAALLLVLPAYARPDDLSLPGVAPAAPKKEEAKKPAADDLSLDTTAPAKKPEAKKPEPKKPAPELQFDDPTLDLAPAQAKDSKKADKKDPKKVEPAAAEAAKAGKAADLKDAAKEAKKDTVPAAKDAKPATAAVTPPAAATPPAATATTGTAAAAGAAGAATGTAQSSGGAIRTVNADKVSAMPGHNLGAPEQRQGPLVSGPEQRQGEPTLWNVSLFAGAERATERYVTDATSLTRLGLSGSRGFAEHWQVRASFDFRTSKQAYVINRPSTDGSPRPAALLDEQRWEWDLGVGYDTGPKIVESGRMLLMPTLSFKLLTLRNEAFPSSLFGLEIGGRFAWELSSAVTVHAEGGYTFNFTEGDTQSALGLPKGLGRWVAGLRLPLNGGFALEFNYVGNVLAFRNVYRVANGAALGFDVNF